MQTKDIQVGTAYAHYDGKPWGTGCFTKFTVTGIGTETYRKRSWDPPKSRTVIEGYFGTGTATTRRTTTAPRWLHRTWADLQAQVKAEAAQVAENNARIAAERAARIPQAERIERLLLAAGVPANATWVYDYQHDDAPDRSAPYEVYDAINKGVVTIDLEHMIALLDYLQAP